MEDTAVGALRQNLFLAPYGDDRNVTEAIDKIAAWGRQRGLGEFRLNYAEQLIQFFLETHGFPAEKTASYSIVDIAAMLGDGERTPDGKADGRKNSWPVTPENPKVAQLAKRIRDNPDPQRTKTDIAREFTNHDERKAQSLLRKLRDYPHLLNGADG